MFRMSLPVACAALAVACGGSSYDPPTSDLVLRTDPSVGSYLATGNGRALYYFTSDFPASAAAPAVSNCAAGCLGVWLAYHAAATPALGAGLTAADFAEFTRPDGAKQTTFKGWPLYTFYLDGSSGDLKGENVDKAWFVLRNPFYTSLLLDKGSLHYLATPSGEALYHFTADTQGTAGTPPASACSNSTCLAMWHVFTTGQAIVPTGVDATAFSSFLRSDGVQQATYKGHPLYTFAGDTKGGDLNGNGVSGKWFAVDPAAQ